MLNLEGDLNAVCLWEMWQDGFTARSQLSSRSQMPVLWVSSSLQDETSDSEESEMRIVHSMEHLSASAVPWKACFLVTRRLKVRALLFWWLDTNHSETIVGKSE